MRHSPLQTDLLFIWLDCKFCNRNKLENIMHKFPGNEETLLILVVMFKSQQNSSFNVIKYKMCLWTAVDYSRRKPFPTVIKFVSVGILFKSWLFVA